MSLVESFNTNKGAVLEIGLGKSELVAQGEQHVAAAGVKVPGANVGAGSSGSGEGAVQNFCRSGGGEFGDGGFEDVEKHSAALIEAEFVALRGFQNGFAREPADLAQVR